RSLMSNCSVAQRPTCLWKGLSLLSLVFAMHGCSQKTSTPSCENLASVTLPNVTVIAAQTVAAGAFTPPAAAGSTAPAPKPFSDLASFCRVTATLKLTSVPSEVKAEVWLPAQGWNGDFQPAGAAFW